MLINWLLLAHAGLTAATAYVWAVVLPAGMLYGPRTAWAEWYERRYSDKPAGYNADLNEAIWFKPLWGCVLCVAGQWCLWMYLAQVRLGALPYHFYEHVYVVAAGIVVARFLTKYLS